MGAARTVRIGVAVAVAAVLLAGCSGSSGGSEPSVASTTTTKVAVTTTAPKPTTTAAGKTTTTKATGTTTEPSNGLEPGDACSLEEGSPDCIDTDDDGEGTYLIGGADCIATASEPAVCDDTDGNGLAGDQG
jgi:hypothetical protein